MSRQTQNTGRFGEEAAAQFFLNNGYDIIAQNIHISHLEIDLIAENSEFLVFVEVKTRSCLYPGSSLYGRPAAAVDQKKRQNIVSAASQYLRQHPSSKQPRIDVVEVYIDSLEPQKILKIEHIRNAFGARG